MTTDVLIIGAGLTGLSCANVLARAGISNVILEADDDVGGRARTDQVDGFLCDRGFQVFSTAYPEARRILNYDSLNFKIFYPGALVWLDGTFHRISDPFRHPLHALQTLTNPIGTMADKFRVAAWRRRVLAGSAGDLFHRTETTTMAHLQSMGFSEVMIDRFFRPFLGGVFMDQHLTTSSRMADFVFHMFASGDIALPEHGIGAIAQQLASTLHFEQIRKGTRVINIQGTTVTLESGETLTGRFVVLATEGCATTQLLPNRTSRPYHQSTCLYFRASEPPMIGPYLILNGVRAGVINSACVLTEVAPSYAPDGQHVVSVTTYENSITEKCQIERAVRNQLLEWFGKQVRDWKLLRIYNILEAQPDQSPSPHITHAVTPKAPESIYVCEDTRTTSTFEGAISSGRSAAEAIINTLNA
ncbi:MAG: oxidoreductase [Nitrospirales bacterium]|nr:MAG: oxidoreductase [Nitrospirales bacterium]